VESGKLRGENSMAIVQSYTEQSLTLSDGKSLSPFQTRKLEKITDRDREYETRGWISIFEDETETEEIAVTKQPNETSTAKTGGKKQ
jgi:hypothetical protein